MLQYSARQLRGVAVATRSGETLGTVKDLVIDAEVLRLAAILVAPRGIVKSLIASDLSIPVEKVIRISLEGVIVEDMTASDRELKKTIGVKIAGSDAILSIDQE